MLSSVEARAPLRFDVAGPWVDTDPWTKENTGVTVNAAINIYASARVKFLPEIVSGPSGKHRNNQVILTSEDAEISLVTSIEEIRQIEIDSALCLAQAVIQALKVQRPIEIITSSPAPPGCGLGTSSAMAVAIIKAVSHLFGIPMTSKEIIDLAREIETKYLGILGGYQDFFAAVYGGISCIICEANSQIHQRIQILPAFLREFQERSLLVYSGKSRLSGKIHALVYKALESKVEVRSAFSAMTTQALWAQGALESGDIELLARIVNESWKCQKILHESVTNSDINMIMEIAEDNGAMGGKGCGAGGGGYLLFFLTDPKAKIKVSEALSKVLLRIGGHIIPFEFDLEGVRIVKAN